MRRDTKITYTLNELPQINKRSPIRLITTKLIYKLKYI